MSLKRLRVVGLNLWKNEGLFAHRIAFAARELAKIGPDIVCLQESFVAPDLGVDAAAVIAAALEMRVAHASTRWKARLHGGAMVHSSSGLAILARGQTPAEIHALPSAASDGARIAQSFPAAPDLLIINTHLTHLRGEEGQELRNRQAAALLALAEGAPSQDVLIIGDLNGAAQDPALAALFRRPDLDRGPDPARADAPTLQGERPGSGYSYPAIDHGLLLRQAGRWRIAALAHALDRPCPEHGVFPSDHRAIVLDLEEEK